MIKQIIEDLKEKGCPADNGAWFWELMLKSPMTICTHRHIDGSFWIGYIGQDAEKVLSVTKKDMQIGDAKVIKETAMINNKDAVVSFIIVQ